MLIERRPDHISVGGHSEFLSGQLLDQEQQEKVLDLSPGQIEIFELLASGLTQKQIADKLVMVVDSVKHDIKRGLDTSGQLTSIHVISRLLDSGQINREKIAEGLDFERYRLLTGREKGVLNHVVNQSTWGDEESTLAMNLGIGHNTFKVHLNAISRKLELNTPHVLLRSRVFMILMLKE